MYLPIPSAYLLKIVPFLGGWLADRLLGDPAWLPHPIVWFGKCIAFGEKKLNRGRHRFCKGAMLTFTLVCGIYALVCGLLRLAGSVHTLLYAAVVGIGVFYCLAGTTLIKEVRAVFEAVDRSMEEGRRQVSRIVGRDTADLSPDEIRAAALETLAENLSDGVVAPMFWFGLLGLPGMMAYKMINTLDSMIGYRNKRYEDFGKAAARLDDAANYLPARLTACLMLRVSGCRHRRGFLSRFGRAHLSPNSGYPEAALAAILDCRFGGTHRYFGETVEKPYIGTNNRNLTSQDVSVAIKTNRKAEIAMGLLVCLLSLILH